MAEGQTTMGDGDRAGETVVAPVSAPSGGAARGRTTRELLSHWKTEAETRAIAQQLAAVSEATTNRVLGISVTVLAAIGGTSAFASLLASSNQTVGLAAGVFTVIAAALSAVQTSLGLGESSGAHRAASAGFFGLKERLEIAIAFHDEGKEVTKNELQDFARDAEQLEKGTKPVSGKIYERATEEARRTAVS
jgi:hypothetical protein